MGLDSSPIGLDSVPREVWGYVCSAALSSEIPGANVNKIQEVIKNFTSLSCTSREFQEIMRSNLCSNIFVKVLGAANFFRNELPVKSLNWNSFIIQTSRFLTNWIEDKTPVYETKNIAIHKCQPLGSNEGAQLIYYDNNDRSLKKLQLEYPDSSSQASKLELDRELEEPGTHCYSFISESKFFWAINEGEGNVTIFDKTSGKTLHRLENLGRVMQVEMVGQYLFILQKTKGKWYLSRLDTNGLSESNSEMLTLESLKLPVSGASVKKLYISEKRISFIEVLGFHLIIWSAPYSCADSLLKNESLEWIYSDSYHFTSHIVPVGENFIVCQENTLRMIQLKIYGNKFHPTQLVNTSTLEDNVTEIAEIYHYQGKLLIFYFCKETSHYHMSTFDLNSCKVGKSIELSAVNIAKTNSMRWVLNSVGKIHFAYLHRNPGHELLPPNQIAIATLGYISL